MNGITGPKFPHNDDAGGKPKSGLEARVGDLVLCSTEKGELLAGYLMDIRNHGLSHDITLSHQRYGVRNESTHLTRGDREFNTFSSISTKLIVIDEREKERSKQVGQQVPQQTQDYGVFEVVEFEDGYTPKVGDLVILETRYGEKIAGFFKGIEYGGFDPSTRVRCYSMSYQRYGHKSLSSSAGIGDRKYKKEKIAKVYVVGLDAILRDQSKD